MKKKLEADLISIAHRILKLKNKEDLAQLHLETQKLYEKLSVLKFVEDNFSDVKPTIGNSNIQELVNAALENELEAAEVAPEETEIQPDLFEEEIEEEEDDSDEEEESEEEIEEDEDEEETFENIEESEEEEEESEEEEIEEEDEEVEGEEESEEEKEIEPHFELFNVEEVEDKKSKTEAKQISFEDLLGSSSEPVFERVFDPIQEEGEEESDDETEDEEPIFNPGFEMEASEEMEEEEKAIPNFEFDNEISINEAFAKTITFGLNDRIAFEKQLFAGSSEDLNRVVSQLSTFDTFEEAQNFIEDMVKPDYDNWEGKEEYVDRFMEIVEKKFD